ncbi:hypothetical protein ACFL2Q_00595 [Thermodesulfobacteriota bacterium]
MTEPKGIDQENVKIVEENMADWSELTFTCPKCGSHRLVKCLGGQVVYALVTEVLYKSGEFEGQDEEHTEAQCGAENDVEEDDIEDAYVEVLSRPDGSELWDFGVDDASEHYCWFRCADCDYVSSFEDGSPLEDDMDLAKWLTRSARDLRKRG